MRRKVSKSLRMAAYIVGIDKGLTEAQIRVLYRRMKKRYTRGY